MTEHNRITRSVTALVLCLATFVTLTATASATASTTATGSRTTTHSTTAAQNTTSTHNTTATETKTATQSKAKLHAKLLDEKVKVDKEARIKGALEVDSRSADGRALEPIIVQRLVAGAWVNVYTTDCRPNYTFRLSVSFSVAADYQLRVYSPNMAVFSSTLLLKVVL